MIAARSLRVLKVGDEWRTFLICDITGIYVLDTETQRELESAVCIDVGLASFAALSDETKVENPRYLRKAEKRLKRAQRRLSRKQEGSKNREKSKRKVAKAHRKVGRQRKDFLHKQSFRMLGIMICLQWSC
jgi:putative transposase